ncbi:hypothetical protein K9N68_22555 [Kovacikia minuta CCNUW1]|uniref:hypothetical protein n=1 Tax=Kovacikia minuta TaxID=2931930 RepID=UPI001CCE4AB5|nr:hypothetical protein [Kovacikia minuta]UBF24456.1 hypothetical protein K9N68_22555 [Kovacikia minuta CCNUW1]
MISNRWFKAFAPLFLSLLLLITACTPKAPSQFSQAQKDSTRRGAPAAVAKAAEQGATFNQFFPGSTKNYDVVPAQEKKGFAEYKLNKDGKTLAMLSISDTTSVPTAALKYQNSPTKIAGYPAIDQGTTTTGLLVNDRYQVKVLSRDPSFTKEDRVAWLQKFDLKGLARLKPAIAPATTTKAPAAPKAPVTSKAPLFPQKSPTLAPQPAG